MKNLSRNNTAARISIAVNPNSMNFCAAMPGKAMNAVLRKHSWPLMTATKKAVFGYYSLSPASIEYARTPESACRGLGRYDIGAYRLARLAVRGDLHGQGLGGQLLLAAGRRCLRVAQEIGGTAMLIDARNAQVAAWYGSYGALPLLDAPLTLLLPLDVVAAAIRAAGKSP